MGTLLARIIAWAMSGAVGSLLVGAGLTLVTAAAVSVGIEQFLGMTSSYLSGVPSDILNLALLCGVGDFLSIVGGALLSRAAIVSAATFLGVKKA